MLPCAPGSSDCNGTCPGFNPYSLFDYTINHSLVLTKTILQIPGVLVLLGIFHLPPPVLMLTTLMSLYQNRSYFPNSPCILYYPLPIISWNMFKFSFQTCSGSTNQWVSEYKEQYSGKNNSRSSRTLSAPPAARPVTWRHSWEPANPSPWVSEYRAQYSCKGTLLREPRAYSAPPAARFQIH